MSSIFSNFPSIFFESRSLHSMKENVPVKPYFIDPTKAFVRKTGKDLTIVALGPSVFTALEVSKNLLSNYKISSEVIDLRSINPIDEKTIISSVKNKKIVVIENGWPDSGIASDIISKVTEKISLKKKPIKICWPKALSLHLIHLKKFYFTEKEILKRILHDFKK